VQRSGEIGVRRAVGASRRALAAMAVAVLASVVKLRVEARAAIR